MLTNLCVPVLMVVDFFLILVVSNFCQLVGNTIDPHVLGGFSGSYGLRQGNHDCEKIQCDSLMDV